MAPTIHRIRHGQGFHNLHSEYTLPDPSLTPLGEEQCSILQSTHFPPDKQKRISLVAASPLNRALHTAWLVFEPLLTQSLPSQPDTVIARQQIQNVALPDAQETSSDPCDVGTNLPVLSSYLAFQHPPWPINLSILAQDPTWNRKSFHGRYSPHSDAIKARAHATRFFLREEIAGIMAKENRNDDVEVVLVSHGDYLHYFSDDWEGAATRPGTGFANCEVRSYQFASAFSDDPDARVIETRSSRHARGLTHPVPSPSEQEKLFVEAMEGWEARGLERSDRLEDPVGFLLLLRRHGKQQPPRAKRNRLAGLRRMREGGWSWGRRLTGKGREPERWRGRCNCIRNGLSSLSSDIEFALTIYCRSSLLKLFERYRHSNQLLCPSRRCSFKPTLAHCAVVSSTNSLRLELRRT